MRLEAVELGQVEALGDRGALHLVRHEIESLAVADLVEPKMVGEAVGQAILPCSRLASGVASSRRVKARSAAALFLSAASPTSPL